MKEEMQVIVLMATFQGRAYVGQQLDSILTQTVPVRVMISDDGSDDGTREILEEYRERYPERIVLRHRGGEQREYRAARTRTSGRTPPDSGSAAASGCMSMEPAFTSGSASGNFFWLLSHAFREEAGGYILLSDQDDVWHPDKVRILLGQMRRLETRLGREHPVLVHSDMEVTDHRLEQISPSFFAYTHCDPGRTRLPELLVENPVTGGALMMNRALLALVWRRPPACYMHDWWIALAASCFGTIYCVRRPLYQYRQHDRNLVGASAVGSAGELADRLRRQKEVQANYRRMMAQAAGFGRMFRESLSREQKQVIRAFLALPRQTPPGRLASIVRYHFYKTSRLQTLAMCFTIPGSR